MKVEWQKELWLQEHGLAGHALARKLHGPPFIALVKSTNCDQFDANLAEDIAGFPLIGTRRILENLTFR